MKKPAHFSADKVLPRIRPLAEAAAQAAGAEVVEVAFVREGGQLYLRVLVHEPGATRIQTCEKVSRALSRELDALEHLIPVHYFLEVSSPGVTTEAIPAEEESS
ncbi:MAG TPA: hypothetical protein VGO93_11860 [Candidatus Xenobia bacterium]|jgi:ribosome maturation factor RimP